MKSVPKRLWIVLVLVCFAGILKATLPPIIVGSWTATSSLTQARSNGSAVQLSNGRILFTGGDSGSGPVQSAEYFAADGTVSSAAAMNYPRSSHFAVVLSDGRVLVGGGNSSGGGTTNSAEIYDPAADSWTATSAMAEARANATAALLQDGTVLIAGGDNSGNASNTIEIFDPASGNFNFAGTLSAARTQHAMAVLPDGRVLILGGFDGTNPLASSDIFDPSTGNVTAGPSLATARYAASATTLLNGRVAVIGGTGSDGNGGTTDLASAEIFDPATSTFKSAGANLASARQGHQAFLLPNNNSVLIVGGTSGGQVVAGSELFTPQVSTADGSWSYAVNPTGSNVTPRRAATGAAMKQDGLVLTAGGNDATGNALASTEIYAFPTVKTDAADYPPGTTVNISGSGFTPGEAVAITLVESPLLDTHGPYTVTADGNGNVSDSSFTTDLHDVNVRFWLSAVGAQSGLKAQNTFTDAAGDNTTATVSCAPNPVVAGSPTTCTATVSNVASPVTNGFPQGVAVFQFAGPSGTFAFSPATGQCTLSQIGSTNNSSCAVTLTPDDALNANVKVNFSSDDNNKWKNSVSGNLNLVVNAGGFSQLQLLVPGETAAPGTATGKTGTPASHVAGAAFNVTVNAVDANWNLVSSTNVIQITSSDANATLPANAGLVGGTRTFSVTLKTTPSQTITASDLTDGTKAPSTSPSIPVTAASANKLVFGQQPTDSNVGTTITPAITVKVEDLFNNIVTSSSASVTLSITTGTGTAGAVLACTTGLSHNASSGVATFPDCNINKAGTNYQLHAVASGLTAPDSTQFNIISPISKLGFITGPFTGAINQCLGPITVQTQNTGGTGTNPSAPVQADLSVSSGGTGAFFSDAACGSAITNVTIPISANSANFFFKGTSSGSPVVQAADHAGVLTLVTQTETINKRTTTTAITLTPSAVSIGQPSTVAVTVTDGDTAPQSNPQGTIAFVSSEATDVFGTCTLAPSGGNAATCSTTVTPAHVGTSPHGITATFTPTDTAHSGSSNTPAASLTVNKADQTITFAALANKTYGDAPFTVSATGGASGNAVTFIAGAAAVCTASGTNGSTITITGAGTCTVTAQQSGNSDYNAAADVPQSFTVNKATATVVVTPYTNVPYDGHAHTAAVTSITGVNSETGATVGTVDVSNTTHTNAGTYATDSWSFTGTANYNNIAATTITDSIAKANATVVVTPYTSPGTTYTGLVHTAAVTSITGVNSETGATVGTVDVSNTTHTNAGTYASDYWFFTGTANYNDIGNTTITDSIAKANATVVVTPYMSPGTTYTGLAHTATVTSITGVNGETGATVGAVDVSHTMHTPAGTYATDYWFFTGTANYNDIGNTAITDSIAKANATVVVTPYSNVPYDGQSHTATVTSITGVNGETGATVGAVDVSHTTHTNAGTYTTDFWTFTGSTNYNDIGNTTITDSIAKANATVVVTPYANVPYDGQSHTATVTSIKGVNGETGATVGAVDVSHTMHTPAGTYATDYWFFTGTANYNDIGNTTITDSIAKANATVVVTPYTNVPYDGQSHTATVTSITGVNGETGATVGAVDVSHTMHTNAGTYTTDFWTFTGSTNYNDIGNTTITDSIAKANAVVVVTPYTSPGTTYTGLPHTAAIASIMGVNGEMGATVGTVDVSHTTHTPAGTYASDYWFFTGSVNYNDIGNTTITDSIAKANAVVVVTPYTSPGTTYTGLPHTATVTSITGVNGETGATVGAVDVSHTTHTPAGTYASDYWFFTGSVNYNDIGNTTITDSIAKANAVVVVTPYMSPGTTYTGLPHTAAIASITGVNGEMGATVGTVDVSHTTHTPAGTYASDYWFFTGSVNYNDIGNTTITDSIAKANAVVVVTPYSVIYDGQAHTATVTSITGVNGEMGGTVGTVDVSHTTHTNPGTYASDYWFFTGTANYNGIGNTTITDSITYGACSLGAGGVILPPINSDGTSVYNRKGGSTIPVKFNVCGANGAPLTDPALVFAGTGGALTMTGAIRGTITVVNETSTNDIPDAAFTWDGQQWHFNMATMNLSSGNTYTFRINLAYAPQSITFMVGVK